MKNIISIGEALMDVYTTDQQTKAIVGGASFNVACSIGAIHNNHSFFMGALGNDAYHKDITCFMEKYNIKQDLVTYVPHKTTTAQVLLDQHGERNFEFIRASDAEFVLDLDKLTSLGTIDFIHFGSATAFLPGALNTSYHQLWEYAIQHQIPFSFDPNFRDKLWTNPSAVKKFIAACEPFLKTAHLIKVSEEELLLLANETNVIEAFRVLGAKNPHALFTVSRGSQDTMFIWNNIVSHVPVSTTKHIKDTTGAGDAFIAKLIDEYVTNRITPATNIDQIAKIVYNANMFASGSVKFIGALTFLDHLKN